ncbi:hypothetical protein D4764_17G0000840 [Takifugu flavidus]|uniref:Uncharacterized protein n=1 Tax=Takifugu flavidus TaxID=433684 RepID=A0A5C6NVL2_9TELE|nr:hypothetical protein D4764_17G0000840 [Takifugu flavidus]
MSEERYLELCENPVQFEHASNVNNVFFDEANKQVFAVRSGGATGVVVKGPDDKSSVAFRMDDKGEVKCIKFSIGNKILAVQRTSKSVDFINFIPEYPHIEFTQECKMKNAVVLGFCWTSWNEIIFVTDQGIEFYQVFPDKRSLKLLKSQSINVNWYQYNPEAAVILLSTTVQGNVLQPFAFKNGTMSKMSKFEIELPVVPKPAKLSLSERDIAMATIYGQLFVMYLKHHSRTANSPSAEVVLYHLPREGVCKKSHILKLNMTGKFALNIVDNLVVVHHQSSQTSLIFDIKLKEPDCAVNTHQSVLPARSIHPYRIPQSGPSVVPSQPPVSCQLLPAKVRDVFCSDPFLLFHLPKSGLCPPVHLSICPPVHLSTCSPVHLSTCPSVHLSTCPPVHLSICSPVHLSTCPPVHLSTCSPVHLSTVHLFTCPPVHLFTCPPVHLSICSPVHLSICSPVHLFTCSPVTCPPVHLFTCPPVHLFTCHLSICSPVHLFICPPVHCSPVHLFTCPPVYLSTCPPVYLSTCSPVHLFTCSPVPCPPVHLSTCPPVHLFTCPPVHLFTCPPVHLSICSPVHLSICPPVHLFTCSPVHLSTCPSVHLSTCPPVHLSTCPPVHLSTCSPVHLSICPPVHLSSGFLWYLHVRLPPTVHLLQDKGKLMDFLLRRRDCKMVILSVCAQVLEAGDRGRLPVVATVFDKLNQVYREYLEAEQSYAAAMGSGPGRGGAAQKCPVRTQAVIDQSDMYTHVLSSFTERKDASHKFTIAVLMEYIRSLNQFQIPVQHYLYELVIKTLVQHNLFYMLHQFLQYHVLSDSKPLACLLLSLESTYPPAHQLSLDMLKRLSTANDEIVEVLLSKHQVLAALRFIRSVGGHDNVSARKFLDAAQQTGDQMLFYTVFRSFQQRNQRLRGSPSFNPGEDERSEEGNLRTFKL